MSLRKDALKLSSALNEIVSQVLSYDSGRNSYARKLASRLGPLVEAYDQAVLVQPSRVEALEALSGLAECMYDVSSASASGDMEFGIDRELETYWKLYTIFRESKYRNESL